VTISFFAKGTNPSTAGSLNVLFTQVFGTGGSPSSAVDTESSAFVLTADWTRYALTVNIPSIAGKTIGTNKDDYLALIIGQGVNASTDAWTLDIWGVQLEAGPTANVFRRNANSLQGELAACQRYYQRVSGTVANQNLAQVGLAATTAIAFVGFALKTSLRASPTSVDFANLRLDDGNAVTAVTGLTTVSGSGDAVMLRPTVASGLTQFRPYILTTSADNGFVGVSAEL
jgi:hypothetical protein